MPEQYPLFLRFSMGSLLLGGAWFLTVANSDYGGPIQLGLGTYQAQSNCSGQAITATIEINACTPEANTASDGDDTDPTMEPTCLVDLATPFAELGVEDVENIASNAYDQRTDSLLGTAQGTPVRCNSIYYSDLKTFVYDCKDVDSQDQICVISLTKITD